jgi:hypothetical protein
VSKFAVALDVSVIGETLMEQRAEIKCYEFKYAFKLIIGSLNKITWK